MGCIPIFLKQQSRTVSMCSNISTRLVLYAPFHLSLTYLPLPNALPKKTFTAANLCSVYRASSFNFFREAEKLPDERKMSYRCRPILYLFTFWRAGPKEVRVVGGVPTSSSAEVDVCSSAVLVGLSTFLLFDLELVFTVGCM